MRKYKTDIEDKLRNRTKPIIVKPEKTIYQYTYDEMVRQRMINEAKFNDSRIYTYLQNYGSNTMIQFKDSFFEEDNILLEDQSEEVQKIREELCKYIGVC